MMRSRALGSSTRRAACTETAESDMSQDGFAAFLNAVWCGGGGAPEALSRVTHSGEGGVPSGFAVTDFAAGSIAAAGLAASELLAQRHGAWPAVHVDRRLASFWFGMTL